MREEQAPLGALVLSILDSIGRLFNFPFKSLSPMHIPGRKFSQFFLKSDKK